MYPLKTTAVGRLARLLCVATTLLVVSGVDGQTTSPSDVKFKVDAASQRLEMVVNSSRILTLDKDIPRVLVNNQDVVRVVPLSKTQVQVSALKPGVTQVNLWDVDGEVRTVDVVVFGDASQLKLVLESEFPNAALRVRPLASSVILTGYVDRPEVVARIVQMAEDYYPKVINNISVGGVQQIALHARVMEVSRTKLRSLGFDWFSVASGGNFFVQRVSGALGGVDLAANTFVDTQRHTARFGLFNGGDSFFGFIEALRQNNLAKVLAEPTITTVSGRPATFFAGGEFPILSSQSLGATNVEFKKFGTRVDVVPIIQGHGNIRLEVRPEVSELDPARSATLNGTTVPGIRTRWVDTAVEMRAGQTLALAGLIQTRVETENRGFPVLADLPWVGAGFRRVVNTENEIELLVTVTPELVDAMDPGQVPGMLPGSRSVSPNDCELYLRGYTEVPKCCPDGGCADCGGSANVMASYPAAGAGPGEHQYPIYEGDGGTMMGPNGAMDSSPMPAESNNSSVYPMVPSDGYGSHVSPGGAPRVAGYPTASPGSDNSYNRSTPNNTNSGENSPQMFGATGYDELDFRLHRKMNLDHGAMHTESVNVESKIL